MQSVGFRPQAGGLGLSRRVQGLGAATWKLPTTQGAAFPLLANPIWLGKLPEGEPSTPKPFPT